MFVIVITTRVSIPLTWPRCGYIMVPAEVSSPSCHFGSAETRVWRTSPVSRHRWREVFAERNRIMLKLQSASMCCTFASEYSSFKLALASRRAIGLVDLRVLYRHVHSNFRILDAESDCTTCHDTVHLNIMRISLRIIRWNWKDTENISMASAQGWYASIMRISSQKLISSLKVLKSFWF